MLIKRLITPIRSMVVCGTTCVAALISTPAFSAGSHDLGNPQKMEFGKPANASQADRTVEVSLKDIYFYPEEIKVKAGETIRFILNNDGQIVHEFNIGTAHTHAEHQAEMLVMLQHGMLSSKSVNLAKMNNHSGRGDSLEHNDPNSKMLEPGTSAELVWTFTKAMVLEFACNIPGHYDSGMVGAFLFNEESKQISRAD